MQENMGKIRHWYEHVPKSGERGVIRSSGSSPAQTCREIIHSSGLQIGEDN